MIINHNISALNTYSRLMLNNTGISKSLEKLSSGMRINRAADDAAGLAISEKMRSQIRGMEQAQRNAQDGISLIQTAEGALSETHSILQRMRELAVQAANDTYTSQDRQNIQAEIDQLTAEIDRISSSTQFNGKNLLDGSTAALVSTDKLTTKVFMRDGLRVLDQFGQKSAGGGNYRLDIVTQAGSTQVQKSDIFKVKHNTTMELCFEATSGIKNFTSTNAPKGTYKVDTVDVSTGAATCAVFAITAGAGNCLTIYTANNGTYAGASGNCIQICIIDDVVAGAEVAAFDETTKIMQIHIQSNVSTLAQINAAITTLGNASFSTTIAGAGAVANAGSTTTMTGGTDIVKADTIITGQYQANKANGSGLLTSIGLADSNQAYNASMYFEVLCVDTTNNQVGVRIYSHQYNACGSYEAFQKDIVLKTNGVAQSASVTVGNIIFDASTFKLGNTNHFSVGDKVSFEVTASQSLGKDKVVVRNDTGSTREWTFNNGTWSDTAGTCILRSYFVNSGNGELNNASFAPTFDTFFCETTSIINAVGGAGLSAVAGDDLEAGMSWTIAGCDTMAATNAQISVERLVSTCGSVAVSATAANNSNGSLQFEVTNVDGTDVTLKVTGWGLTDAGASFCVNCLVTYSIGAASSTDFAGALADLCVTTTLSGTWAVGDKFTTYASAAALLNADSLTFTKQQRDATSGCLVAGTSITRMVVLQTTNATTPLPVSFMELDANGTGHSSTLTLTRTAVVAGAMTFQTTDKNAATYKQPLEIGDVARLDTKLYDVDKFWDANGNFILETPQTISLVQGDGKKTSITITGADTFASVRDKLNNAIAEGLGQADLVGTGNVDKFVSFVETPATTGLETVKGTFVIRSAIAGKNGELNLVGDDNVIAALSLSTIQKSAVNTYTVDVTEAHYGCIVAEDVQIADNNLIGVVHKNVDVQFAANTGLEAKWNETTKSFDLLGGVDHWCSTFIHLADRTMVFQIGANQKQDVGAAIGNMNVNALGLENVQVTTNSLANDAIGKIDAAISRVSAQRATLGALQNRLDHSINSLATTTENLTAAESRIRDVDMAKEMMNFTKFNILNQAATAMLAQANQLPQTVLQLLK